MFTGEHLKASRGEIQAGRKLHPLHEGIQARRTASCTTLLLSEPFGSTLDKQLLPAKSKCSPEG